MIKQDKTCKDIIHQILIDTRLPVSKDEVDAASQLLLFVLELKVTVLSLAQIVCKGNCKKLLPDLSELQWLVQKLDDYCCDLNSACADGVSALPTKFDFGYLNSLTQAFVEQTIKFCLVHTAQKHRFKTVKQAVDYVSFTVHLSTIGKKYCYVMALFKPQP